MYCKSLYDMVLHGCSLVPMHVHMAMHMLMCVHACVRCADGHMDLSVTYISL